MTQTRQHNHCSETDDCVSKVAAVQAGEKGKITIVFRDIHLTVLRVVCCATFAGLTILQSPPLHAQDADIKKLLKGVDLTGVQELRLSPNGELAAGLTGLHPIPGPRSGSFSLIKIWSIRRKELMHEFRVPGKAYEAVFSPDGSTIVAADRTGNLGHTTTIRAWDLAEATMRKIGTCGNEIGELRFSPDGSRIAAVQQPDPFFNPKAFAFQLKVWRITGKGNVLSVRIPHPLGEWMRSWPPIDEWSKERKEEALRRVTPKLLGFSSDGKQLICETEAGLRTTYDSQSGRMLKHANVSSVGLFKSMLMIALDQVPEDVKSLAIEITPLEKEIRIKRAADGWWWAGADEKSGFKVDGGHFVSILGGVETKEHIAMRLGLKDDTNLAELSSLNHPLGVIKIERDEMGLKFRLQAVRDGNATGETLQGGEVRWAAKERSERNE